MSDHSDPVHHSLTAAQRSSRARIAAFASWANTDDRSARTSAARQAAYSAFERIVDPDGKLDDDTRREKAEAARRMHFQRMAYRSALSRRNGIQEKTELDNYE